MCLSSAFTPNVLSALTLVSVAFLWWCLNRGDIKKMTLGQMLVFVKNDVTNRGKVQQATPK